MTRGQANLVSLAVALLLLTTAVGTALVAASGAFADAGRHPEDRRVATSVAARLVAADGPLATRPNVLERAAVENLTSGSLTSAVPVANGRDVRVVLGDRTVGEAGDPDGGVTVRRLVVVASRERAERASPFPANDSVRLPEPSPNATVRVAPTANVTVRTVRVNGRVVLHNDSGVRGRFELALPRDSRARLSFDADAPLGPGDVRVTYYPTATRSAVLAVTADA